MLRMLRKPSVSVGEITTWFGPMEEELAVTADGNRIES